jgi:hypothetical protein
MSHAQVPLTLVIKNIHAYPVKILGVTIRPGQTVDIFKVRGYAHITSLAQRAFTAPTGEIYVNWRVLRRINVIDWSELLYIDELPGPPTGPAGGDLDGEYPNPEVTATAALPVGSTPALDVGTSASAGVSTAEISRVDHVHKLPFSVVQTVLGGATSSISVNSVEITNVLNPTAAQSAATRDYVDTNIDANIQGLDVKQSVLALSAIHLASLSGLAQTVDGVLLDADSMRVLLIAQSGSIQNGIWLTHSGAWTRPLDFDVWDEAKSTFVFVEEGTVYQDTGWVCTSDDPLDIIDIDPLVFTQFTGGATVTAGAGLTKTGNSIDVIANADGSITVNANDVQVGVLATDAQHGSRGGGSQHSVGTTSAAGFMSTVDKSKIDGLAVLSSDGGPFEGYAAGFLEILPAADPFPTSWNWWTSAGKTLRIVDLVITRNANNTPAVETWRAFASNGITVVTTAVDTVTYSGIFEMSRTRTIT